MNAEQLEKVISAMLYEGYILYPYRASTRKNRQRFTFGRVYPEAYHDAQNGAEPCTLQTECLVKGREAVVKIAVRYLQPMWRQVLEKGAVVLEASVAGKRWQTWQEAIERKVELPAIRLGADGNRSTVHSFSFPAAETQDPPLSADIAIRRRQEAIEGVVKVAWIPLEAELWKVTVGVTNTTVVDPPTLQDSDAILMRTFASTHVVLTASQGTFVSLLEPAAEYAAAADACRNVGVWPVLVGDEKQRERDTLLASPIILYDYPKIAPESAGDLFDGGEIDEILTLRIMTMTDEEKAEMRQVDEYARRILERTEALPQDQLMNMHGTVREVQPVEPDFFNPETRVAGATVNGIFLKPGDHVRIRPKRRADAMDIVLAGKDAVIEAVEQDLEGSIHFALVLADDPGADIGFARMPGHRFFYTSEEVEPLKGANGCAFS